jgi:hypothetical protein
MGKSRQHAEGVASNLAQHNFSVLAFLDETMFSPANVGIISRALFPRPKVFLIGGNFSDEEAESGIKAWEEYVKELGVGDTTVIRVGPKLMQEVGPAGVGDWIVGELKRKYK